MSKDLEAGDSIEQNYLPPKYLLSRQTEHRRVLVFFESNVALPSLSDLKAH